VAENRSPFEEVIVSKRESLPARVTPFIIAMLPVLAISIIGPSVPRFLPRLFPPGSL